MIDWKAIEAMPVRGLRDPLDEMLLRLDPYLQSGIALTGFNRLVNNDPINDFEDDGILSASEIRRLNLEGTELVVLSACETGLARINNGNNVAGFRSAFLSAGAKNVIMSLWNISDKWTYALMESFYHNYFAGDTPPKALNVARKKVREQRKKSGLPDHPFYWAAFVIASEV